MKTIKKIKESSKAVAGTALLVGATLAGGAAFATAQSGSSGSGSMTLGDYPSPFIGEDGTVDSTIVMGENAKATDVVAASNIAGQLGNDAFTTESVSAGSGGAGGSYSATGGVTLDTANDNIFFGQGLTEVRDTLTDEQLETLGTTTFQDDGGEDTEIEYYLYPGTQNVQFGKPEDRSDQDPITYISNPSDVGTGDGEYLFQLQANFEDNLDFTSDDVQDEEIELFGNTYTVSTDSTADELVLYGGQETVSVESGSSTTVSVEGEEVTIEVVAVTSSNPGTAAFRVNGELRQEDEDQEFTVNGQEIRLQDVIQTSSESSQGVVTFAIGSQEISIDPSGGAIQDADDDDIDGSYAEIQGANASAASGLNVYVGAQNDNEEYVMAGDSYSHPAFPSYTFRFGGLSPDAQSADEGVTSFEFSSSSDETIAVNAAGESVELLHAEDRDDDGELDNDMVKLADDDDEHIYVAEGSAVREDEYFTSDAGDFSHLWEVTNIDRDETDGSIESSDEATIELEDAVSGRTVEVDLDAVDKDNSGGFEYGGSEIIDGQTYYFHMHGDSKGGDPAFWYAYGDDAGTATPGNGWVDTGASGNTGAATVFPAVDVGQSAMAPTTDATVFTELGTDDTYTLELPSTESTDRKTAVLDFTAASASGEHSIDIGSTTGVTVTDDGSSTEHAEFTVGSTVYTATFADTNSGDGDLEEVRVSVSSDQVNDGTNTDGDSDGSATDVAGAGVHVLEPENDNDAELGYFVQGGIDSGDDEVTVNSPAYLDPSARQTATLESNDDVTAGIDVYGTYTEYDSDEQGTLDINVPEGQSTVGAAFTTDEGSLSASAGGSGTVESMSPTGWSSNYVALDSDSSVSNAKQNSNLVLVGGPAANSLVSELVEANKTMPASDYTEGQGMLQLVEDAFSEGHDALIVAGYSGEDTRQAGAYLTNYEQHSGMLEGSSQVSINTAEGTVVQ